MSKVRDLPPVSGSVIWARQVGCATLYMYLSIIVLNYILHWWHMCTTKLDISILHMFKLCSTSGNLREVNMVQLRSTVSRVWKAWCPLVQDKLFCLWAKCEFVFTCPKDYSSAHFSGQAILSVLSCPKRTRRVKSWTRKENTILPTGQVYLNLLLLAPWLSLDNNTSTWEVGDHIREVLDELLPPVFLSTFFNYL